MQKKILLVNEILSKFLQQSRARAGKSQAAIAQAIGLTNSAYCSMEKRGSLPRYDNQITKLAEILDVTKEELLQKNAYSDDNESENIISLIKVICETGCEHISLVDIKFLMATQAQLQSPISVELCNNLMKHRIKQTPSQ